jgi:hypothetical protein
MRTDKEEMTMWLFFNRMTLLFLCVTLGQACGDDQGTEKDTETGGDADADGDTDADADGDTDTDVDGDTDTDNANLLFSDDFESGDFIAWDWHAGSIVSTDAARTGTYGLEYCYDCFDPGGNTTTTFSGEKVIYLSFWIYHAADYYFVFQPGRHGWRLRWGDETAGGQLDTTLFTESHQYVFLGECGAGYNNCDIQINIGYLDTQFTTETWQHVEMETKMNTDGGTSDGYFKLWVDDRLVNESTGLHQSDSDSYYDELFITSNDDNCVGGASACTYYLDDVEVWDANPN